MQFFLQMLFNSNPHMSNWKPSFTKMENSFLAFQFQPHTQAPNSLGSVQTGPLDAAAHSPDQTDCPNAPKVPDWKMTGVVSTK